MGRNVMHGLAIAAALAAALTLAGCGRKGPLDPPPTASAAPQGVQAPGDTQKAGDGEELPPVQAQKKRIILDGLLN